MGQSLYELSAGFNNIMDLVLDETMDLDALEEGLQSIETDVSTKVSNGIGLIQSLTHYSDGMKAEAKRLTDRQRVLDNRIKAVKAWYQVNLDAMGKNKVETERGTMSVQNNPPALKIIQPELIPAEYQDVVPEHYEINKSAVKAALVNGAEIPGASLVQGRSLRIR